MNRFLPFLFGYCRLRVLRSAAGEVMNLFRTSGYIYRDFEFCGDYACFSCSAAVSGKVIAACEARGISVSVTKESGIPFILKRYRHRYGVFFGILICAFIVFISGRMVWDIRVQGNRELSEEEVIDELAECGFSVGMLKKDVDIDAVEARVLVFSDGISWISVNLLGTVANVEIREVEAPPNDEEPNYAAANLIAQRAGIIEDFRNVRGEVAVKIGDAVAQGDLLVSGLYGDESASFRYTCAKGEVLARTWHDLSVEVPLKIDTKRYSEEVKCEKSIIFFKKEVKFTINSGNLPTTCDTIDTVEYFRTPWGTKLPIGIRTVRYYEYSNEEKTLSPEAARELALYKLRVLTESELDDDAELVGKKISEELVGEKYVIKCRIECIENIAAVKEIEIEGLPPSKRSDR